jgi:hypothetical protein
MAAPDLRALLESWTIHLRAEREAEGTVRLYASRSSTARSCRSCRRGSSARSSPPARGQRCATAATRLWSGCSPRQDCVPARRSPSESRTSTRELAQCTSGAARVGGDGWARRDMLDRYAAATASERAAAEAKSLNLGDL